MVFTALWFFAGDAWLQYQATLPAHSGLVLLAVSVLGLALLLTLASQDRTVLLRSATLLLAGCLGFYFAAWRAELRLSERLVQAWEGVDVDIIGVVADLPQTFARGARFDFDLENSLTPGAKLPARIRLSWYEAGDPDQAKRPAFKAGTRWRLSVRLRQPRGSANEYGFDYEAWLMERGIGATGYVVRQARVVALGPASGFNYSVQRYRQAVRDRLAQDLGASPYVGVMAALAVGDQQAIPDVQWRLFARTGISHLVSISGLHVTMLAALVAWLIQRAWRRSEYLALRIPAVHAGLVGGLAMATLYVLVAGFQVPAQRTLYMLAAVVVGIMFMRSLALAQILALAGMLVLWVDPWAVLAPGFWLSFGAVALIFLVSTGRVVQPRWWEEWLRVQIALSIGLTPITLAWFQQTSWVAPLANVIAIPVVSFVVTPIILVAGLLPWPWLAQVAERCFAALVWVLEPLGQLEPLRQHAPHPVAVALALMGCVWLLMPRGLPARWLGLLLCLPLFMVVPAAPAIGTFELTALDVGQGLAVVVRTQQHNLLYDAGPAYAETDAGQRLVAPWLIAHGIRQLDVMLASHADLDHVGGAQSVLSAIPASSLVTSLPAGHLLAQGQGNFVPCVNGTRWEWDGVRFDVLHPDADLLLRAGRENARSCVLKIRAANGLSALLPGDIEADAERSLLDRDAASLDVDVVVAPHHGSKTSSTQAFVDATSPQLTIFSVGHRNRFGHPRGDVIERYREAGSALARTDRDGAIRVLVGVDDLHWSGARSERRRYYHLAPD